MFTANNGAYRTTKIVIDWMNIGIGVATVIVAAIIFFMPGNHNYLLPVIFCFGAAINGLNAVKQFLRYQTKKGMHFLSFAILLGIETYLAAVALW